MTAEQYANPTTRADLARRRITALGLYLTAYVTDKEAEIFTNTSYGGFHAMVRNRSIDDLRISGSPATEVRVAFTIDMAGPKDLLTHIPATLGTTATASKTTFDVQMPKDASIDPTDVPWRTIRAFDPKTYSGELETVRFQASVLPESKDAYPEFSSFFSDGVFDITLFQGHDYNAQRSDLRESEEQFDWLVAHGFTAPVASYAELVAESGPFTRDITAGGKKVKVEVRIFHSDMFKTARAAQKALAISELVTRDVFFYNGHAGPYYGFYLDADKAAQVEPAELQSAPFTSKKQIFIANGCQTYSQYADNLYANPKKTEANLDVITTVNFSYGDGTFEFLDALLRTDDKGRHDPQTMHSLVDAYNSDYLNGEEVFVGAMGIDGNPVLHPYAATQKIGASCSADSDCGDATGNRCILKSGTQHVCAAVALARRGCPTGTRYKGVASAGTIVAHVCAK